MSLEQKSSSQEALGSFRGCLVEGDPEQRKRERRIRWRALAVSVVLQGAAITAILLLPLFGKPARLALAQGFIPLPPYHYHGDVKRQDTTNIQHPRTSIFTLCLICPVPQTPPRNSTESVDLPSLSDPFIKGDGSAIGPNCPGCIAMPGTEGPLPPQIRGETPKKRLQITHIDPAMLIRRIEPLYPTLARQTGRSGRVELRAVIATDGSIQSLQVVSGDPLFIQSALQAVQQWRYKPTILNGHAVEIDTFITVVYNINR